MPVPQITPADLRTAIADGALVVDVREHGEWDAGHLEGSLHVPLSELGARWLEIPAAERTVVVCRSGARSDAAATALDDAGRQGCENLAGGLIAWAGAGLPLEPADGFVA